MNWLIVLGVCMMIYGVDKESEEKEKQKICKNLDGVSMSEKKRSKLKEFCNE